MLPEVLATALAALLPVLIGAIVVCALTAATESVLMLRWRNLRLAVSNLLFEVFRNANDKGGSEKQIRAECRRGATRILSAPDGGRLTWIQPEHLRHAVHEVTDLGPEQLLAMESAFVRMDPAIRKRFKRQMRTWVVVWAALLSLVYLVLLPAAGYQALQPFSENVAGIQSVRSGRIADLLLSIVFISIGAHLCFRAFRKQLGDDSEFHPAGEFRAEKPEDDDEIIGRDDCIVRAINFAGGGFSTIMQLGVTHALMTIQGRAPDAVIGVSAGAVQAAALAEVLQAGEEIEAGFKEWQRLHGDEKLALQSRRLQARVIQFRKFLTGYQTIRERLFDALLPDAYQVDAHDPLEPLQSPLFDRNERRALLYSLETESGLIRLYNNLLQLDIPVGVVVRVIRRVLGFRQAGNLRRFLYRAYFRLLECVKVWLLIGGVLTRASPVVGPIRRAFLSGAAQKVRAGTAESIIFRFNVARNLRAASEAASNFLTLLALWLGIGLAPAMIPAWFWDKTDSQTEIILIILGIYILAPLALSALSHDPLEAINKTFRGLLQAFWLVFKWTLALYLILGVSMIAGTSLLTVIETRTLDAVGENIGFLWDRGLLLNILRFVPLIPAFVALVLLIRYMWNKLKAFRVLRGDAAPAAEPNMVGRLLASYRLSASLFSTYPLKIFIAELFDRDYFGKVNMDSAIATALEDRPSSSIREAGEPKTVGYYSSAERSRPIHVGLAVANVANGNLETVPRDQLLVDGLMAAFAVVPLFPPQILGGRLYVDGSNVANIPTRALLSMLRNRINPKSRGVHIYSVVPLPFSRPNLFSKDKQSLCLSLWDTVMKALFLQRFRDAVLERRLTEVYTHIIPRELDKKSNYTITVGSGTDARQFFRGWVTPVELEEPVSLNARVLTAGKEERHKAILETVADGCRASLETMIRLDTDESIPCRLAVRRHLMRQQKEAGLTRAIVELKLPGAGTHGPGLKEVCEHCTLYRDDSKRSRPQTLDLGRLEIERPSWPHERSSVDPEDADVPADPPKHSDDPEYDPIASPKNWPRRGRDKPTISMLLSGGVFRGVYQMGVLNALNLLNLRPDVIGGASVGSITAGMITKVFSDDSGGRQKQIARLAAIYLGIDRLILTDRFADFVRNLTIRAAATKFSISEADDVFRKYDFPSPDGYNKSARDVIAGIERLLYVNPYQLNALVSAVRNGDYKTVFRLLRTLTQQWLDKMGVGEEVLGADALDTLIRHFVIPDGPADGIIPASFGAFDDESIHLLATTTNVTRGELEILGGVDPEHGAHESGALLEGLLASSAFPGVFRPRLSYDLRPGTSDEHQYIDGGVMDNFPIDAVIQFLLSAQTHPGKKPRILSGFEGEANPHLIFAASLQVNTPKYRHPDQWQALLRNWPALLARTKELGYNTKLDTYEAAERHLRSIYTKICADAEKDGRPLTKESLEIDLKPLNIEVVTVKPEWLCGTFAFHPMLGFRRRSQAMSIAHGCASTLLRFKSVDEKYRRGWEIDENAIPVENGAGAAWDHWRSRKKEDGEKLDGRCWLRPDETCPFSRKALEEMNHNLAKGEPPVPAVEHLAKIHEYCVDPSTHMPEGDSIGWFERFLRKRQLLP